MLKLKWDSRAEVGDITCPILFVSGSSDSFVPTRFTKELYETATKALFKDILIVEGADHNNTFMIGGASYFNKLEEFYQRCANEPIRNMAAENLRDHTSMTNEMLNFPAEKPEMPLSSMEPTLTEADLKPLPTPSD